MKHPWKRSLACLVALLLMLQLLPTGALAAGRDPGGRVAQVEAADASTQLLTNPSRTVSPEAQIALDQEVTFLVELEEAPLISYLGKGYASTQALLSEKTQARNVVDQAQAKVRQAFQSVDGLKIVDTYSLLLNGFSVSAAFGQMEACSHPWASGRLRWPRPMQAPKPPVASASPIAQLRQVCSCLRLALAAGWLGWYSGHRLVVT